MPDPIIDDELVVTIRIRLAGRATLQRVQGPALISLPGRLHNAVKDFLYPGDVDLAGIEVSLPDFRPINMPGKLTHEFKVGGPNAESLPEPLR